MIQLILLSRGFTFDIYMFISFHSLNSFLFCILFFNKQFTGTKALNRTHASSSMSRLKDNIAFVTVFTIYNSSLSYLDDRSSNTIVGDASYNKVERSMAILNVFINFIQVTIKLLKFIFVLQEAYCPCLLDID